MAQNLWQVVTYDDLLYFLRNGKDKLIVLSLVLRDTDEFVKKMIRTTIKKKAQEFPLITFIYYTVREDDFGRISLLEKKTGQYPKICHIYNVTKLLNEITSIDDGEVLAKKLSKMDVHCDTYQKNITSAEQENPDQNEDDEINEHEDEQEQQKYANNNSSKQHVSNHQSNPHSNPQFNAQIGQVGQVGQNNEFQNRANLELDENQFRQTYNPVVERKKMLEKLLLIKEKSDEFTAIFLDEMKKKKKIDEKEKEKEKDK